MVGTVAESLILHEYNADVQNCMGRDGLNIMATWARIMRSSIWPHKAHTVDIPSLPNPFLERDSQFNKQAPSFCLPPRHEHRMGKPHFVVCGYPRTMKLPPPNLTLNKTNCFETFFLGGGQEWPILPFSDSLRVPAAVGGPKELRQGKD